MYTMLVITIDCIAIFFLFRATLITMYRKKARMNTETITACMTPHDKAHFYQKVRKFGGPVKMLFALNKWRFQDFYGTIFEE